MRKPEPKVRWVAPHALGFDGFRWHTRAWCYTDQRFKDFVLARILQVAETKNAEIDLTEDVGWLRQITLRFAPHPDLKDGARKAVELDYGMKNVEASITTRVCLSYYLERQFGLDAESHAESPKANGERQQIVLVNRDEVEAARKEVEGACGLDQSKTSKDDD